VGVTIHRRGAWWWLDISQDGRRFRRPTHTQDKRKAEIIRHELESAILAGEWNVALALETTVARGIERFQAEYEPIHHAASTRKYTKKCFERFLGFITARRGANVAMDLIGKSDIEAYQMDRSRDITIRKALVSASTVNRDVRELSTLCKWANTVGICRRNACQGVRALRGVKRKVQPLTDEEIQKLLDSAGRDLADLISLILNTGMRLGEALHLRREDIQLESELLVLRSRPDYLIKDREEREIPLVAPAMDIVRRRIMTAGKSGLLFQTSAGTVFGNRNLLRDLYGACERAKVRRMSWYLLRHTFASTQAKVLSPAELKTVMGHGDVRTADKYYVHLNGRDAKLRPVAP
jgi:integrase